MSGVTVQKVGLVAFLGLNRPEKLNALTGVMQLELLTHLRSVQNDPQIKVIVLRAAGRAFSVGVDAQDMKSQLETPLEGRAAILSQKHDLISVLRRSPKPTIAAVQGLAIGAGLGIALACDFRFVSMSTRLRAGFAPLGVSGDYGVTSSLVGLIGLEKTRRFILLDETITGEDAVRVGLAYECVEEVESAAMSLGTRLAENSSLATALTKLNLAATRTLSPEHEMELEAWHQAQCSLSPEHREAVDRLAARKRAPSIPQVFK